MRNSLKNVDCFILNESLYLVLRPVNANKNWFVCQNVVTKEEKQFQVEDYRIQKGFAELKVNVYDSDDRTFWRKKGNRLYYYKIKNGKVLKSISYCHKDDEFNVLTGINVAKSKLENKSSEKEKLSKILREVQELKKEVVKLKKENILLREKEGNSGEMQQNIKKILFLTNHGDTFKELIDSLSNENSLSRLFNDDEEILECLEELHSVIDGYLKV